MTFWKDRSWQKYKILLGVAGIVIIIDQLSKAWVRATLWPTQVWIPIGWLEPYFKIVNWKNTGGSFGIFPNGGTFFSILALLAIAVIIFYYPRINDNDWSLRWALAFLLGGVSGNLIDRLHQGYVTDFISIGPTYVLNLADVSNLAGVIIVLIGVILEEQKKRSLADSSPANDHSA